MPNNLLWLVARRANGEEIARFALAKRMGRPPWYLGPGWTRETEDAFWRAVWEDWEPGDEDEPVVGLEFDDPSEGFDGFKIATGKESA